MNWQQPPPDPGQQPQYPQQQPPYPQQPPPPYQQQYPPQQPPYQQWPGQPPYPQPPGRGPRRGILIAVTIGGLVFAVLAGLGLFVMIKYGDGDGQASPGSTPPVTSTNPSSANPSTTPTEEPVGRPEKLDAAVTALTTAGFACVDSFAEPVLTVSCFADPALPNGDQRVIMQAPDNDVTYAHIEVNTYEDGAAATRIYKAALNAVTTSVLPAADAAVLRSSTAAAPRIGWGTATQHNDPDGTRHELKLTAKGKVPSVRLDGQTRVTVPAVVKAVGRQGLACKPPSDVGLTSCAQTRGTEVYSIDTYSPCGTKIANVGFCKQVGDKALYVHGYVGFGRTVNDAIFNRIRAHLELAADLATAQSSAEVHDWIGKNLDGKPHHTNLAGLHFAILPGSGGRAHAGTNPNIVAIEIDGIRGY
ncbi:hypothetical protein [Kribbella sp. NPDC055071]